MATPAKGSATKLRVAQETTYGTAPASGWFEFSSTNLPIGESQPILPPDLIGLGRGAPEPEYDVIDVSGTLTLPLGQSELGLWLTFALGAATTSLADPIAGWNTHTWVSGKNTLPSFSIEGEFPDISPTEFYRATGLQVGTSTIVLDPEGRAYLELAVIGKTARRVTSALGGSATDLGALERFSQPMNFVQVDDTDLGKCTTVNWPFNNNPEQLRYVGGKGEVGDVLAGLEQLEGQMDCLLHPELNSVHDLFGKADNQTNFDLKLGFQHPAGVANSTRVLTLRTHQSRALRPTYNIDGPGGVQTNFPFTAIDNQTNGTTTVTLVNEVTSYPS